MYIHNIHIIYMYAQKGVAGVLKAVWCSDTEICCGVLHCVAVCCSVLQCYGRVLLCIAMYCSVMQRVAACCTVLHCVAVCCSVLQRAAV